LGVLCTFKYAGFFVHVLGRALSDFGLAFPGMALPVLISLGISFLTFRSIAYLVDVYLGTAPATRD
jgi:D-alanyl-lipoteichoic acid acyltransferase DltB (MBOAT superfamily)